MRETIPVDPEAATAARGALLEWHHHGARSFPWRHDPNPFHILMAEMMLRRTQARQVVPIYSHFIERFRDIASLDQAPSEEVAGILHSLGLGWRAANFKHLAEVIMTQHAGQVPRDREALLALPGVGPYVAEAVRCFAFDEQSTLVDTNTVRVAARYFGFDYNPESRRQPAVIQAVSALIEPGMAAESNYALLDFAATVCRARDPDHTRCPLAERCVYYNHLIVATVHPPFLAGADDQNIAPARTN